MNPQQLDLFSAEFALPIEGGEPEQISLSHLRREGPNKEITYMSIGRKLSREESLEAVVNELIEEVRHLSPASATPSNVPFMNMRVELARHVLQGGVLEHKLVAVGGHTVSETPPPPPPPPPPQETAPTQAEAPPAAEEPEPESEAPTAPPNTLKGLPAVTRALYKYLAAHRGKKITSDDIIEHLHDNGYRARRGNGKISKGMLIDLVKQLRKKGIKIDATRGYPGYGVM